MKNTDFEYCNIDKYNVPEFGFKIHISATIENYSELFLLLYPYLCKEGVVFKYLKNQLLNIIFLTESLLQNLENLLLYILEMINIVKRY